MSAAASVGVVRATSERYFLAEGPVWDAARSRLLWVDILEGHVHSGTLEVDGTITPVERFAFPDVAGAVAVAVDGALVVAGADRLHFRDATGLMRTGERVLTDAARRFNDGKADPRGELVVGTQGPTDQELLVRFGREGVDVLDHDLELSNGLAWSSEGRTFYSVDTGTRRIHRRTYDPATGAIGAREVFVELDEDFPDGITTDAEDHVWVAVWGSGCVERFDPSGARIDRIEVPAPHTSSVAFAGDDLDVMVVTTAREGLDDEQLERYPLSGCLFTCRLGIRGNAPYAWNGEI